MKTYCKPATVNIEDWKFNELAVVECFRNKRSRKDFQRLLCKTGKITKREIVEDQLNKDFKRMKKATIWAHDKFGLKIKDIWQFYQVASFDEERENLEERRKGSKKRTPGVDMMGYVVRRRYTIIRGRVFRRIRRQVLRAWGDFKAKGFIPWWRACRIAAFAGNYLPWLFIHGNDNLRRPVLHYLRCNQ